MAKSSNKLSLVCDPAIMAADVWVVAMNMRQADRDEIQASYGAEPLTALFRSIEASDMAWAIRTKYQTVGLFGAGRDAVSDNRGMPWLLATDELANNQKSFLRQCRGYIKQMHDRYSFLENWVDARNLTSIKWLEWCGFTFDEPEPFGVMGLPFHRFEMRGKEHVCTSSLDVSGDSSLSVRPVSVGGSSQAGS